jgi:protein-S-isoprenylcysteine O-methyltransferase Ste14
MGNKIVSITAFLVSVLALMALIMNHGLFTLSPVAITVQVLAAVLMIWARLTFGIRSFHASANPTAGKLIMRGPYKHIRHPIYSAVVVFAAVGVLANWSVLNGFLGLAVVAGMVTRSLCEEHLLLVQYPDYADYARRTWRMIPYVF